MADTDPFFAAAAEVLSNGELLSIILAGTGWQTRSVCEAWRRRYDGGESRPAPSGRVQALRDGSWSEDLGRARVSELLRVDIGEVRELLCFTQGLLPEQHGCAPDEFGEFRGWVWGPVGANVPSRTILRLFQQLSGIDGMCRRVLLARAADTKSAQAALETPFSLDRGLQAPQLPLQESGYWHLISVGLEVPMAESFRATQSVQGRRDLRRVLKNAMRELWLLQCCREKLSAAVSHFVCESCDHDPTLDPCGANLVAIAKQSVRSLAMFELPSEGVPWLPGETTEQALDRAEAAADPAEARRKRLALETKQAAQRVGRAAEARLSSFSSLVDDWFGTAPQPPLRL